MPGLVMVWKVGAGFMQIRWVYSPFHHHVLIGTRRQELSSWKHGTTYLYRNTLCDSVARAAVLAPSGHKTALLS